MTSNQYDNGVDVESDSVEEWESDFDSDDFDDEWDLYDDDDNEEETHGEFNPVLKLLYHAVEIKDLIKLKTIIKDNFIDITNTTSPCGRTLLNEACRMNCLEIVRYLLDEGVDVNEIDHVSVAC